jgi:hypothetical protein
VLHCARAAQVQDAREVARQIETDAITIFPWRHGDVGNHGADEVHRLAAELGIARELLQIRGTAPIELCGFALEPVAMLSRSDESHSRQIRRVGKRFIVRFRIWQGRGNTASDDCRGSYPSKCGGQKYGV